MYVLTYLLTYALAYLLTYALAYLLTGAERDVAAQVLGHAPVGAGRG